MSKMKMNPTMPVFSIIGAGRSGAGLARYFVEQGFEITALVEKNSERFRYLSGRFNWRFLTRQLTSDKMAAAHIVLLTVQDDLIAETAEQTARLLPAWINKVVAHTSGTLPCEVLKPFRRKGAAVASVHPVYAFALNPEDNRQIENVWFDLEGDSPAVTVFEQIFRSTGNPAFRIGPEQKEAVHLASVFSANFLVALAEMSRDLLGNILPENQEKQLLHPLLTAVIEQISLHGAADGLTGPIQRGDAKTVQAHLKFLKNYHPEMLDIYIELSEKLLSLSGVSSKSRSALQQIFKQFSNRSPE